MKLSKRITASEIMRADHLVPVLSNSFKLHHSFLFFSPSLFPHVSMDTPPHQPLLHHFLLIFAFPVSSLFFSPNQFLYCTSSLIDMWYGETVGLMFWYYIDPWREIFLDMEMEWCHHVFFSCHRASKYTADKHLLVSVS